MPWGSGRAATTPSLTFPLPLGGAGMGPGSEHTLNLHSFSTLTWERGLGVAYPISSQLGPSSPVPYLASRGQTYH